MTEINLKFEIPKGFYTEEELKNHIQNNILNIMNTPINGYSRINGNFAIPLHNII
jgi:hypothetical protein